MGQKQYDWTEGHKLGSLDGSLGLKSQRKDFIKDPDLIDITVCCVVNKELFIRGYEQGYAVAKSRRGQRPICKVCPRNTISGYEYCGKCANILLLKYKKRFGELE